MKAFASAVLMLVIVAAAITGSSALYGRIEKDPYPAVRDFLKKESDFLDRLSNSFISNAKTLQTPFSSHLSTISHLIDSMKRTRTQIIMDALRGWKDIHEPDFKLRLLKAVDAAYSAADSKLIEITKLLDDEHLGSFRSTVDEIVAYLRPQFGIDWLLNFKD